jgi:VWFA-related protein
MVGPRIGILLLGCLPLGSLAQAAATLRQSGPASAPAATPAPRFGDEIAVRLVTVVARVVDGAGDPLLGLAPKDFRVRVGRREVPVAAVDWVASGEAAAVTREAPDAAEAAGPAPAPAGPPAALPPEAAAAPPPPGGAPGKLVVLFVQADNNAPSRVRGHLRTLPFTRELLASLQPEDGVAVVSFDSHLKLWQDFTRDREPVPAVIYQAIHFGGSPPEPNAAAAAAAAAASPSLARHFDGREALRAASPERALAVTAAALAALPGEKVLVLLGWGLGDFSSLGTRMVPAFAPAVKALAAARTTVFALDVTEADSHDLEVGLRGIAEATGGTYDKTNLFPALAIRQLARTISGYYVLSLDSASLPRTGGRVEVELRGRRGTVLQRPLSLPAG